jgi:hypothetical protein
MRQTCETVLNLELGFADKERTLRLLDSLWLDPRTVVNIMRARITERHAQLSLELRGPSYRVAEVASLLTEAASSKDPRWRPRSQAS